MPAYIQNALADEQYLLDSLYNDLIIRTATSNQNILFGMGSNVKSKLRISNDEVYVNARLRVHELITERIHAFQVREDQPFITSIGSNCNLVIDHSNDQIRIGASNDFPFFTSDMTYQLYVKSNVYAEHFTAGESIVTSNLDVTGTLKVLGEVYTIDTNIHMTERFSVSNDGTGTAMTVIQSGEDQGVAEFVDSSGTTVLSVRNGGKVGINVAAPTEASLTVNGNSLFNSNMRTSNLYVNGPHMRVPHGPSLPTTDMLSGNVFFDTTENRFMGYVQTDSESTTGWRPVAGGSIVDGDLNTFVRVNGSGGDEDTVLLSAHNDRNVPQIRVAANSVEMSVMTSIHDELVVESNVSIQGTTSMSNDLFALSNVFVLADTYLTGSEYVTGDVFVSSSLNVDMSTHVGEALSVGGDALFMSDASVEGMMELHGTFEALSNVNIGATLSVNEEVFMGSALDVAGNTTMVGELAVQSHTALYQTLSVGEKATFSSKVMVADSLSVQNVIVGASDVRVLGQLSVQQDVYMGANTVIRNHLSVGGVMDVHDAVRLGSNVDIEGALTVIDSVDIGGALRVIGPVMEIPSGPTEERPDASTGVPGTIYFNTSTRLYEGLYMVNDTSTLVWKSLGGVIDADMDTFISSEDNKLTFFANDSNMERMTIDHESFSVHLRNATFASNVSISGMLSVQVIYTDDLRTTIDTNDVFIRGMLDVSEAMIAHDTIQVYGAVDLAASLSVQGDVDLQSSLFVHSNVHVMGPIMEIPYGTTTERPGPFDAQPGAIFFNTTNFRFEGLHDIGEGLTEWKSLTGLTDVDMDTFVSTDNNKLTFHAHDAFASRMVLDETSLDVKVGNVRMADSLSVASTIYVPSLIVGEVIDTDDENNISGTSAFVVKVEIGNTLSVAGATSMVSKVQMGSSLSVTGFVHIEDQVQMGSSLSVSGPSDFVGAARFGSNLRVIGPIMEVPFGTLDDRPNTTEATEGAIFFNKTNKRFEGLHDLGSGNKQWMSLGGVMDVDMDTYVSPDFNTLSFYAHDAANPRMTLDPSTLDVKVGSAVFDSNVVVKESLSVPLIVADNIVMSTSLTIGGKMLTSNMEVTGAVTSSMIPSEDSVYDLGSSERKWRDLYLSGNTLIVDEFRFEVDTDTATNKKTLNIRGPQNGEVSLEKVKISNGVGNGSGNTATESTIDISGPAVLEDTLSVGKEVYLMGTAYFDSSVDIRGVLSVHTIYTDDLVSEITTDALAVGGTFQVERESTLTGDVEMLSNLTVRGDLTVDGATTVNTLRATGSLMEIPSGDTSARPSTTDAGAGAVFFNITNKRFEGLHDFGYGNKQWMSLGGVMDVDMDTFISTDQNTLAFHAYDATNARMVLDSGSLDVRVDHVVFGSNVHMAGVLRSDAVTTSNVAVRSALSVGGDVDTGGSVFVGGAVGVAGGLTVTGPLMEIPVGPISTRPSELEAGAGAIFFNTTNKRFEGLHDLGSGAKQWMSLGGVMDVDMDTYISTDENTLAFYAESAVTERLTLTKDAFRVKNVTSTIFSSNVTVEGVLNATSSLAVAGDVEVGGNAHLVHGQLSVASNVTVGGEMGVVGEATFGSNVVMWGPLFEIPSGPETDRPSSSNAPGAIYYNTTSMEFQGLYEDEEAVREWRALGGGGLSKDADEDTMITVDNADGGDTDVISFFTGNAIVPRMTLSSNALDVYTPSVRLHGGTLDAPDFVGSNVEVSGSIVLSGSLTLNAKTFPSPTTDDAGKLLAVDNLGGFVLVDPPEGTELSIRRYGEFKSLYGTFETGVELDVVSGLFDFGASVSSGGRRVLFDGATEGYGEMGVLAPNGTQVDLQTVKVVEEYNYTNGERTSFINVSMRKSDGSRMNSLAGISVGDLVLPEHYFFVGTIDPNHDFFKHKFKLDMETYYRDFGDKVYGRDYGYAPETTFVNLPSRTLHLPGTTLFVVEYINTYDNCRQYDTTGTNDESMRYYYPASHEDRRTSYYAVSEEDGSFSLVNDGNVGLYPHIAYKRWRNNTSTAFYEKSYDPAIGWGDPAPNATAFYQRHHSSGMLKRLYEMTHNYIKYGSAFREGLTDADLDSYYNTYVAGVSGHNLAFHSNLHSNGNFIEGNYNAVSFTKDAFPLSTFVFTPEDDMVFFA